MSYTLTFGPLHILSSTPGQVREDCSCHEAKNWCAPSFVFSVHGQVHFRSALNHLATCQKRECRSLRSRVIKGMKDKMEWLMTEGCILGCVFIQPTLYGSKRITMKHNEFPVVARHLARCPKESCAQLRRAVLLTIRDELRPEHLKKS